MAIGSSLREWHQAPKVLLGLKGLVTLTDTFSVQRPKNENLFKKAIFPFFCLCVCVCVCVCLQLHAGTSNEKYCK